MNKVLYKIFRKRLGFGAFLFSGLGLVLGLSLVLISVQLYSSLFPSFSEEINKNNYLILNKDVNIANTLFNSTAVFSKEEIAELQKQPFVNSVGLFTPNHYRVKAYGGGSLRFMTDLFFESIPDKYIDQIPYNFEWHEGDDFLPIIVSDEFLNLYNYGYALSSGLPQVSKSTISLVPIQVEISGGGKIKMYKAKVVGFSERIASVLVPQTFMEWANLTFGNASNVSVSRVMIELNKSNSSNAQKYLNEKNYLINSEKMASAKVNSLVKIGMDILIAIGTLFICFSFVIILMNFSIIISEAKNDIILLLQLGYKPLDIAIHLLGYLISFISIGIVLSFTTFITSFYYISKLMTEKGLDITFEFSTSPIYVLIVFMSLMLITGAITIYRKVNSD